MMCETGPGFVARGVRATAGGRLGKDFESAVDPPPPDVLPPTLTHH